MKLSQITGKSNKQEENKYISLDKPQKIKTLQDIEITTFFVDNINIDVLKEKITVSVQPGKFYYNKFVPYDNKSHYVFENKQEKISNVNEEKTVFNKQISTTYMIHDEVKVYDSNGNKLNFEKKTSNTIHVKGCPDGVNVIVRYKVKWPTKNSYSQIMNENKCSSDSLNNNLLKILKNYITQEK